MTDGDCLYMWLENKDLGNYSELGTAIAIGGRAFTKFLNPNEKLIASHRNKNAEQNEKHTSHPAD
jgi:hypothetical protein